MSAPRAVLAGTDGLVQQIHRRLLEDPVDDLAAAADGHARALAPLLAPSERREVIAAAVAHARGLGPLEPLLADPTVTEVMVNAGRDVWVERHGRLVRAGTLTEGTAAVLIERILAPLGLRIDRTSPLVDARLPDGSRVHAVIPPVAPDGPCLTIRRFSAGGHTLEAFAAPAVVGFLYDLVAARVNIVVSGPTSAGKTTFLNALAGCIGADERIVTIEDAAELRLDAGHVVRLEARPPSIEGVGEVPIRALVRAALRLRPDRLVIGEVRGAEALDMVLALNTGHDGSLSTCHANGPEDAIRRLEAMVLMGAPAWPPRTARDHVRASVDVVVHLRRGQGGRRQIAEIVEVAAPEAGEAAAGRGLATGQAVTAELTRGRAGAGTALRGSP